jgi:hypothetical protein
MNIILKRTVIIAIIIITIIIPLWYLCSPRKQFRFNWSLNESKVMLQENHKTLYFLGYNMEFWGPIYYANAIVTLDNKYETYTLHNISFEWDNNNFIYEINKKNNLEYNGSRVRVINSDEEFRKTWGISIPEVDKWYEIKYLEGFPEIDFLKIFKGKKIKDRFTCKITINFSFDNEPEMTLCYYSSIYVDSYSIFERINMTIFP